MKEQELNTLMSVVSDPIKNVYKIESRKDLEEIQRIIRIFNISENDMFKKMADTVIRRVLKDAAGSHI